MKDTLVKLTRMSVENSKTNAQIGQITNGTKLMLDFTDDINAVVHNTRNVREILSSSEFHTQKMELRANEAKTKCMIISRDETKGTKNIAVNNYNQAFLTNNNNRNVKDVAASRASDSLSGFLKSNLLTKRTMMRYVRP